MIRFSLLRKYIQIRNLIPLLRMSLNLLRWGFNQSVKPILSRLFVVAGVISVATLIMEFGFNYPDEWTIWIGWIVSGVIYFMVFYEITSLLFNPDGIVYHLKNRKVELAIVLAILIQWAFRGTIIRATNLDSLSPEHAALIFLSISQLFFLANNLFHLLRNAQFSEFLRFHPAIIFLISFGVVIVLGVLLLSLPRSQKEPQAFVDLLFIAVSATCVTGLSTVDITRAFTPLGQGVILALIQIGGLGLMTLTSFFSFYLAGRTSVRSQMMIKELLSEESMVEVKRLIRDIALLTFTIEFLGSIYLYFTIPSTGEHTSGRLFNAIFHSVSAFCNAGFSLYSESLVAIRGEGWSAIGGVMLLIVLGSLGFPVLGKLISWIRWNRRGRFRFGLTARLVLTTNLIFWSGGFLLYYLLERDVTLAGMGELDRLLHSLFFTITARTAGFNTLDTAAMGVPMLFASFLLMWVGASPGSTGGGIKTTTFAIAIIHVFNQVRGKERVDLFMRTISPDSVRRAFSVVVLSFFVIFFALFLLLITESTDFVNLAFETVSAYGTVGLSRGITGELTSAGKVIIMAVMFIGRVGALTFLIAIMPQAPVQNYRYPTEYIISG